MSRKPGVQKERHHVHLFPGDWDWLMETYRNQGLTPSFVIAKLVSSHRRRVSEKIAQRLDQTQKSEELDLDLTTDEPDPHSTTRE